MGFVSLDECFKYITGYRYSQPFFLIMDENDYNEDFLYGIDSANEHDKF